MLGRTEGRCLCAHANRPAVCLWGAQQHGRHPVHTQPTHTHNQRNRVAASFISQLLVTSRAGRDSYNVPVLLLTYLSTSVFTVFLPLVQLKSLLQETWLLR